MELMEQVFIMYKNIEFSTKKKQEAFLMSIWEKNAAMIYHTCLKICHDRELAKDLQQDIFIKLFTHVHIFKDFENKESWIFYVCRNHCLDYVRKQKSRPEHHLKEAVKDYLIEGDNLRKERAIDLKLEQAFSILNLVDRMILELYFIGGLSIIDISNLLGLSKPSISTRMKTALKKVNLFLNEPE
jgi:RNA polymerase sigma factor (sigma-70 family)